MHGGLRPQPCAVKYERPRVSDDTKPEPEFQYAHVADSDDLVHTVLCMSCVPAVALDTDRIPSLECASAMAAQSDEVSDVAEQLSASHLTPPLMRALSPWLQDSTLRLNPVNEEGKQLWSVVSTLVGKQALGSGATADVRAYQVIGSGDVPGMLVAVKSRRQSPRGQAKVSGLPPSTTETDAALGTECAVLDALRDAREAEPRKVIPCVTHRSDTHLAMAPVCSMGRLKKTTLCMDAQVGKQLVRDLISAAKLAATAGYAHRDIRPDNVLVHDYGGEVGRAAVLVDWAFAVKMDNHYGYSGTITTASQRVLKSIMDGESFVKMKAADDAASVVKTCWVLCRGPKLATERPIGAPPDRARVWHGLWEQCGIEFFPAMEAALKCDPKTPETYDELLESLCKVVFTFAAK